MSPSCQHVSVACHGPVSAGHQLTNTSYSLYSRHFSNQSHFIIISEQNLYLSHLFMIIIKLDNNNCGKKKTNISVGVEAERDCYSCGCLCETTFYSLENI